MLRWVDVELGEPGPGEARVAHRAVGINFIDTYHRSGLYPVKLPSGLGGEGAGVVVSVGPDVDYVAPGDRVAYAAPTPAGSYSEERIMPAKWLTRLPDAIDDETAAAMMLKGMTSWYLLRRTYRVQPGDWILIYAAAGGVGTIATQWARSLGANVIGVVSTEESASSPWPRLPSRIAGRQRYRRTGARPHRRKGLPVVYDPSARIRCSHP